MGRGIAPENIVLVHGASADSQSFAAWVPGHAASIVILANDEAASI